MRTIWLSSILAVAACGPVDAPSLDYARIVPEILFAGDVPTCDAYGWRHADREDLSRFSWSVNGSPVGTEAVLDYEIYGGDTVTCTVTPFDGEWNGSPVSVTLIVQNTEPSVAEARITPAVPVEGAPLQCAAHGFDDPDQDLDLTRVGWMRDGVAVGAMGTAGSQSVPFPGPIEAGHWYRCMAVPFDGQEEGLAVWSQEVLVQAP